MTLLTGTITDLVGNDYGDFTLIASPTFSYYNATGGFVAAGGIYFSAASGSLSANIPETETSGILVAFRARYTADGIFNQIYYLPVLIPNVSEIALSDLLVPIQNPLNF